MVMALPGLSEDKRMTTHLNLVFGGRGLIGTALANELKAAGEAVEIYDLVDGWDLREKLPAAPGGNAFCWFLAWDVGGAKYIMDPASQVAILENNVSLCRSVFTWLRGSRIPFLFTSTQMAGYPNAYGLTKQMGEFWAGRLHGSHVCRLWNVYGPEPQSIRSHVISDLVHQGSSGHIHLQTSGDERRQFISSQDCARALIHQRDTGQAFADITSGEWIRIKDLARIVADAMGAVLDLKTEPGYESLVEPTRRLAGWEPEISLAQGVDDVIKASGLAVR